SQAQPELPTRKSHLRVESPLRIPTVPADEPEPRVQRDSDEQLAATETKSPTPIRRIRVQRVRSARPARNSSDPKPDHAVASNGNAVNVVPEDLFGEVAETRDRSLRLTDLFAEDDED